MLQSYSPIGKFIFLTVQNPSILDSDGPLKNNVGKLVANLKANISAHGIFNAQQKMEDELFGMRFEILEYLQSHSDVLEDFEATIIEQIGTKYFTTGKYKELGNTVSDTLEVYLSMFSQLLGEIKSNMSSFAATPNNIKFNITLSSLRHIYSLQPNPELGILIEWFSASTRYDFFLIAAEFIINNEITVDETELGLLTANLKKAVVDFGVYTMLCGLWKPQTTDETQLMRNIKIKAAAHKIDAGLGKSISIGNLQNLLHS
jgi:hypothetical protein